MGTDLMATGDEHRHAADERERQATAAHPAHHTEPVPVTERRVDDSSGAEVAQSRAPVATPARGTEREDAGRSAPALGTASGGESEPATERRDALRRKAREVLRRQSFGAFTPQVVLGLLMAIEIVEATDGR